MAGAIDIRVDGLDEALQHLRQRADRMRDLSAPLKVVAREIELRTDTAFQQSKSPFGEAFAPLSESTLKARARKLPGASKRSKASGRLTKGAKGKRSEAIRQYKLGNAGVFKPLVDTARARNSQHVDVSAQALQWTAVGYLGPHMTGGKRLPKRNVAVFEKRGDHWVLHPDVATYMNAKIAQYVQTGRVT